MKIKIKQKHIDRAIKIKDSYDYCLTEYCSTEYCPIALAVREHTHKDACVDPQHVAVFRSNTYTYYKLPTVAKQFINDFDRDKPVKPIEFELTPL